MAPQRAPKFFRLFTGALYGFLEDPDWYQPTVAVGLEGWAGVFVASGRIRLVGLGRRFATIFLALGA